MSDQVSFEEWVVASLNAINNKLDAMNRLNFAMVGLDFDAERARIAAENA